MAYWGVPFGWGMAAGAGGVYGLTGGTPVPRGYGVGPWPGRPAHGPWGIPFGWGGWMAEGVCGLTDGTPVPRLFLGWRGGGVGSVLLMALSGHLSFLTVVDACLADGTNRGALGDTLIKTPKLDRPVHCGVSRNRV